jgi:plastocyanin
MKRWHLLIALLAAVSAVVAAGKDHIVSQKNKAFSAASLKVKVGESVTFRNDDPFFHNIFSLSEIQSFDLGSYPQGQERKATFTKPGRVEVECAIHPDMKMVIEVEK